MEDEIITINRGYVSVLPRQPYYDWAAGVFQDAEPMVAEGQEATAYAFALDMDTGNILDAVKPYFQEIFEMELFALSTDPDTWPPERTWELFTEWFDIHAGSMLWDLDTTVPLVHDEE